MERTYERAATLVGRAAGPLARHLGPCVTSLIDQHHTASVIYIKVQSPGGIDPATSFSPSSEACDDTDYVPAAYPFALMMNRVTARRDIVRRGR
jgi:hypothetical protein